MRILFVWCLLVVSGAAALGWQFVWTEQLGSYLGHEIVAVLAVMAAFFGGLSLGALLLSQTIAKTRWPGRWYAALEAVILVWGAALLWVLPTIANAATRWIGPQPSSAWHWCVAFALPLVLLLPATLAMGATLPAVERQLQGVRSTWSGLYAANTLGAVVGVLGVVFVLVPWFGLSITGWVCCALNGVCAGIAWWVWAQRPMDKPLAAVHQDTSHIVLSKQPRVTRLELLLLCTGFLGIGYEVVTVRVLSQVTENTVFSYAIVLTVYLVGTALGAAVYQRHCTNATTAFGPTTHLTHRTTQRLMIGLAAAVLVCSMGQWWADWLCALPAQWWGPSAVSALGGEALAACAALLVPAAVMGALFSHLCVQARAQALPLGRSLAFNTLGSAMAPWVIGVWAVPTLGAGLCLVLLFLGYVALQLSAVWRQPLNYLLVAAAAVWVVMAGPLRFVELPQGGKLLSHRDGVMAAVSVVQDSAGIAHLHINNRVQEGSSAGSPIEARLALLPLLLHASPSRALYLGLGTGYTAKVAASDPTLHVEAVELLPEVIDVVHHFQQHQPQDWSPPARIFAADARRFVQSTPQQYDVIVSDLFHPARNGAGSLYTVEQFEAVRQRLSPGGIFCQWLAVHQMEVDTLRSIVAAFVQVYPDGVAILASNSLDSPVLGLIARPQQPTFNVGTVQARLVAFGNGRVLQQTRLTSPYDVLGSLLADSQSLAQFAAGAVANTDDHPIVVHTAPWATYAAHTTPRQRLLHLLDALQLRVGAVLSAPEEPAAQRLEPYWQARAAYVRLGMQVSPSADPTRMLDQLQTPLLALLRISPDFQPALDPLLALSSALQQQNPKRSRDVLSQALRFDPTNLNIQQALAQLP